MKIPKLTEIEDILSSHLGIGRRYRIAILRNIVLESIEPYIRYLGLQDQLCIQVSWGDYDNILQEANGLASEVVDGDI